MTKSGTKPPAVSINHGNKKCWYEERTRWENVVKIFCVAVVSVVEKQPGTVDYQN